MNEPKHSSPVEFGTKTHKQWFKQNKTKQQAKQNSLDVEEPFTKRLQEILKVRENLDEHKEVHRN